MQRYRSLTGLTGMPPPGIDHNNTMNIWLVISGSVHYWPKCDSLDDLGHQIQAIAGSRRYFLKVIALIGLGHPILAQAQWCVLGV